ncbi:CHASE2 domain-containing protein [Methylococcaceae bacterium WWC4]|nr:CHASE2 domain-containing protein [Methylococcaceae bacterium WWC4]
MPRRLSKQTPIALILAAAIVTLTWTDAAWRLDRWLYDACLTWLAKPASADIVIVEVDQRSLGTLGRWPWPRDIHAKLLRKLAAARPTAIALDFVFSEADAEHPEADAELSMALRNSGPVILPVIIESNADSLVETLPIASFRSAAILGHANLEIDKDGVGRGLLLRSGLGAARWPAMALAAYAVRYPDALKASTGARTGNNPAGVATGLAGDYRVGLPFYDTSTDFVRVSYADVLSGAVADRVFKDKFVLVGLTAAGIERELPAPLAVGNRPLSGVEFVAAGLDALLKQKFWQELPWLWQCGVALLLTGLTVGAGAWAPARWLPLVVAAFAVGTVVLSLLLLAFGGYWFAPAATVTVVFLSYPLRSWRQFEKLLQSLFAERKRAYITLNAIVDAVVTTRDNGEIDFMNSRALDMFGPKLLEAGRNIDQLFSAQAGGKLWLPSELIAESRSGNAPLKFEHCRLTVSDQQSVTANLVVAPLFGSQGEALGAVITVNDLSERMLMAKLLLKKAEEFSEIRESMDRVEQMSTAKSQFMAQIGHELRTPLNAVIGFAQLLQMEDPEHPLAAEHLEAVNEIFKAGMHLLNLINDLLDLARIESGKLSLNLTAVELTTLLDDCLAWIAPLANPNAIVVELANPLAATTCLYADAGRAKQVLLNFLSNAVKYNRPGGRVVVSTQTTDAGYIRIAVTDTGPGLSTAQLDRLFKSFERLDAEHSGIEGTGIGLAIAKQLTELMAGRVGVSSIPEVGSTFWAEFPRA